MSTYPVQLKQAGLAALQASPLQLMKDKVPKNLNRPQECQDFLGTTVDG